MPWAVFRVFQYASVQPLREISLPFASHHQAQPLRIGFSGVNRRREAALDDGLYAVGKADNFIQIFRD
ncbi:hypothetical protein D3C80_2210080 [compost metagenome]